MLALPKSLSTRVQDLKPNFELVSICASFAKDVSLTRSWREDRQAQVVHTDDLQVSSACN